MQRFVEAAGIMGIIVMLGVLIRFWGAAPDSVPEHFGRDGRPDSFGDKRILLLMPAVSIVFYIVFSGLQRIPHALNYIWKITPANAYRQYELMRLLIASLKAEIIWIAVYVVIRQIQISLDISDGLGPVFLPVLSAVLLATVSLYLYLAYQDR